MKAWNWRHNMFYEEKKVCNKGRARYLLDVASSKNFSVTDDFAAAVCNLPEHFDKNVYRNFIRDLKIRGRRRQRKRRWKSEFVFFQSSSRLLQVTNFVKL